MFGPKTAPPSLQWHLPWEQPGFITTPNFTSSLLPAPPWAPSAQDKHIGILWPAAEEDIGDFCILYILQQAPGIHCWFQNPWTSVVVTPFGMHRVSEPKLSSRREQNCPTSRWAGEGRARWLLPGISPYLCLEPSQRWG